jgi:hypothetical protein
MLIREKLLEVTLSTNNNKLDRLFNYALNQMFQKWYLDKINEKISNAIKIIEVKDKRQIVGWQKGNSIYINAPLFYAKPINLQIRYLLHEFVHLLQKSENFIFFKKFKELDDLGKNLQTIVNNNLIQSLPVFLTGKEQELPTKTYEEILAYLMNDKIKWDALKPEGRRQFIKLLKQSNLFNLKTDFWQKRLT